MLNNHSFNFVEYEGHLYLMDSHGEVLTVDNMKEIVSSLIKTIEFQEANKSNLSIKKANLVNELNNLSSGHSFKSNYPINLININKTRMRKSNMRKSNRPYVCKNCLKEFDVREGEDRYWINSYNTIPNSLIHFEEDSGSCCSKECLNKVAYDVAVESINPKYRELFKLEYLFSDIKGYMYAKFG
ncbi:hypothetical protein AB1A69_02935 [Enterococcus faecium]|uniref:hypothetical protein n=1 Tax=Enterococcus TaxID=1350 RepID=UPI000A34A16F|nr:MULTISPECIES: hypothetical protein [Enterococcus]EHH1654998.1 hypothetical protein [Enterococcus faecium]EMF0280646.1 hypothetical protein [Enterococcus faecium]MEB4597978.1 hypothetical protein [Enterococcus sp. E4-85]MEB4737683.1 hypothetical protein [Enterococcus sp. E5-112]OTN78597.1 hypothetical protein A5826_001250 [Enterococcus faecium]